MPWSAIVCPRGYFVSKLNYHFSTPGSDDKQPPFAANPFNENLPRPPNGGPPQPPPLQQNRGRDAIRHLKRPTGKHEDRAAQAKAIVYNGPRRELKAGRRLLQFNPEGLDDADRPHPNRPNAASVEGTNMLTLHDAFYLWSIEDINRQEDAELVNTFDKSASEFEKVDPHLRDVIQNSRSVQSVFNRSQFLEKHGPCPTLLNCVGYQACLFRFSNEFCLQDPYPGQCISDASDLQFAST